MKNNLLIERIKKLYILISFLFFTFNTLPLNLKIGQVAKIASLRENQVSGFGLVVGLPGTGDSRNQIASSTLANILNNNGIKLSDIRVKSRNIAAVMVMAKLPPFARQGDAVDIWISSIGDAKSLKGGYLLQTPLKAADGKIYAVAQASVTVSQKGRKGTAYRRSYDRGYGNNYGKELVALNEPVDRNNYRKTTTRVPGAAIIEKSVIQPLFTVDKKTKIRYLHLSLHNFSLQTADSVIKSINAKYTNSADLQVDGTIKIKIVKNESLHEFVTSVFKLPVVVSTPSRVVLDPRSSTIVMGEDVSISSVSVTKNGISIKIDDKNSFASRKNVSTKILPESPSVAELVKALNSMGLSAQEIIDILKAIHAAGALHAELVIL